MNAYIFLGRLTKDHIRSLQEILSFPEMFGNNRGNIIFQNKNGSVANLDAETVADIEWELNEGERLGRPLITRSATYESLHSIAADFTSGSAPVATLQPTDQLCLTAEPFPTLTPAYGESNLCCSQKQQHIITRSRSYDSINITAAFEDYSNPSVSGYLESSDSGFASSSYYATENCTEYISVKPTENSSLVIKWLSHRDFTRPISRVDYELCKFVENQRMNGLKCVDVLSVENRYIVIVHADRDCITKVVCDAIVFSKHSYIDRVLTAENKEKLLFYEKNRAVEYYKAKNIGARHIIRYELFSTNHLNQDISQDLISLKRMQKLLKTNAYFYIAEFADHLKLQSITVPPLISHNCSDASGYAQGRSIFPLVSHFIQQKSNSSLRIACLALYTQAAVETFKKNRKKLLDIIKEGRTCSSF